MPTSPFDASRRLTDATVREIVGAWLTQCRLHPRKPTDPIPPIVRKAFKRFSEIRSVTKKELQGYAEQARRTRLVNRSYSTQLSRLESFPRDLIPPGGRLVVKIKKTNRPTKNTWPSIHLELPGPAPGYVLRYKATRYGYFHSLSKQRPHNAGQLATFDWQSIPVDVLPSLHPAVRAFFDALKPQS